MKNSLLKKIQSIISEEVGDYKKEFPVIEGLEDAIYSRILIEISDRFLIEDIEKLSKFIDRELEACKIVEETLKGLDIDEETKDILDRSVDNFTKIKKIISNIY